MKKQTSILMLVALLFFAVSAFAQTRDITGTVTDEYDQPIIGATVKVTGTTIGAITDLDGKYTISGKNIERLEISSVGYKTQYVEVGTGSLYNVKLKEDVLGIDEVVVTGVATGTSQRKLGFTVAKVNDAQLNKVPGADPANALRGKVTGVRVVQPSGDPANATEIRLRGSTTISGSQRPLVIVDGVIIEGGDLRDINMEDVESMEIVKGAAAASLYGSLAGNGVIQIKTKRGKSGQPFRVNVKSEYGTSNLAQKYPVSYRHDYALNPDGSFALDGEGKLTFDADGIKDNLYPGSTFDNQDAVFKNQNFYTINANISGALDKANYFVSYQNSETGGIVDGFDPLEKDNVRLNFDVSPISKIKISGSASYNTQTGYNASEYGQGGSNAFFSVLSAEPFIDLTEVDENGTPVVIPSGYDLTPTRPNFQNPLYFNDVITRDFGRDRLIGGISVDYTPLENLSFNLQRTLDNLDGDFTFITPKDFESPSPGNQDGSVTLNNFNNKAQITSFQANFTKQFGNINTKLIGKLTQEEYDRTFERLNGTDFYANGISVFGNTQDQTVTNTISEENNRSGLLDATVDWSDKIILNGNIRREGSSLNSESSRNQTFGRVALAYILSDDINIKGVDFLKLRASYGTAGNRPAFGSIYETLTVNQSGINFGQTGAVDLQSSVIKETEIGFDMSLFDRVNVIASYSNSDTENDVLRVGLPLGFGYTSQSRNIGEINNKTYELGINAVAINKKNLIWDVGLNWDKIKQEITDLGVLPPFTRNTGNAVNLFRVEAGQPYGTMYGNKLVTSLDQLVVDASGNVMNQYSGNAVAGGTVNDYEVNADGFVVRKGTFGTADEKQLLMVNEDGTLATTSIGNTNPNFNLGFSSTLEYNGFTLYGLLDYQDGGDIYNYTKQLLYFRDRHEEQDAFGIAGHHKRYSDGNSTLYNAGSPVDYFVEDGTFLKVREISLGYDLNRKKVEALGLGNVIKGAKLAFIGRNLFTFTDYTGYDPEVAINQNPTNFRLDEYAYPNYRTFTGRLEITF